MFVDKLSKRCTPQMTVKEIWLHEFVIFCVLHNSMIVFLTKKVNKQCSCTFQLISTPHSNHHPTERPGNPAGLNNVVNVSNHLKTRFSCCQRRGKIEISIRVLLGLLTYMEITEIMRNDDDFLLRSFALITIQYSDKTELLQLRSSPPSPT